MSLEAPCTDCLTDTRKDWYMVHNNLWPSDAYFLCIDCLEKRLGRKLNYLDFTPVPCNLQVKEKSKILRERLKGFNKLWDAYYCTLETIDFHGRRRQTVFQEPHWRF